MISFLELGQQAKCKGLQLQHQQPSKTGYSAQSTANSSDFFSSSKGNGSSGTNNRPFSFTSDREFDEFIQRARQEELRKNASAYNYESQEQTGQRFQQSSDKHPNVRNAEDINNYFTKKHDEYAKQYTKPTANLGEHYEKMFGSYQGKGSAGGGGGNNGNKKFSNEMFEDMLRHLEGQTQEDSSSSSSFSGGGPKKVKPVSLLSNSSSSRLDYAQSLFGTSRVTEDDDSSVFLSTGLRTTTGSNLRDAHDPRKHLVSSHGRKVYSDQGRMNAQQYENMRNEDIFRHATSSEEQQAFLQRKEAERQLRNRERLYRMYT